MSHWLDPRKEPWFVSYEQEAAKRVAARVPEPEPFIPAPPPETPGVLGLGFELIAAGWSLMWGMRKR